MENKIPSLKDMNYPDSVELIPKFPNVLNDDRALCKTKPSFCFYKMDNRCGAFKCAIPKEILNAKQ